MDIATPKSPDSLFPRSAELMSRDDTALLVIDMQVKLLSAIPGQERLLWNARRLLDAARLLGLPFAATEQYPQGLGSSSPLIAERVPAPPEKRLFSCRECSAIFAAWRTRKIGKILLAGIESHVCVQQTALDLLAEGYRVYLAVDAIGARFEVDHAIALRRMEASGATLTSTEAALFEWCETAAAPEFKQVSALVRESPPG